MAEFVIKKGFDLRLTGRPETTVVDHLNTETVSVYPLEFDEVRFKLKVEEGDLVKRGSELLADKRNDDFKIRAPASGKIRSIIRGARRFVEQIVIDVEGDEVEQFKKYSQSDLESAARDEILNLLTGTAYLGFIRQRPFSIVADPSVTPKSIFVNAMNTGPFLVDANVVVADDPEAFQAGLTLLTRLTSGAVHVCVGTDANDKLRGMKGVEVHSFAGPHPAGNSSVHIGKLDPMSPTDVVWTVKAADLVLIGRLFLDGALPTTRIISVGGPGVKSDRCKHYRLPMGGDFTSLLTDCMGPGEQRVLCGDVLSGGVIANDGALRLLQSSISVIPEDRERRFLGWTMPGFNMRSFSRTFASTWLCRHKDWRLGTNQNGGVRAMVLTGLYDKVMPLNIMVDFLLRAALAGDTDESIRLGILETDPEDFALCDFICPCKTEPQKVIRDGLAAIREEGI